MRAGAPVFFFSGLFYVLHPNDYTNLRFVVCAISEERENLKRIGFSAINHMWRLYARAAFSVSWRLSHADVGPTWISLSLREDRCHVFFLIS